MLQSLNFQCKVCLSLFRNVQRKVSTSNGDARQVSWYQGGGNAVFILLADQMVRIVQFECQAKNGRYRCECYVALVPVEQYAHRFLAVPAAFANDAAVDECRGIGTCLRRGQGKARNFIT